MGATQAGVVLGTAAYMAPEQIKGKEADRRADIWAFGVVLYELLTGERPFQGRDSTEIMAHAVMGEPKIEKAPAKVRRPIGECLKKEPEERLRWGGDVGRLLQEEKPVENRLQAESQAPRPWVVAGIFALLAIAAIFYVSLHRLEPNTQSLRYSIDAPPDTHFANTYFNTAISPDGKLLA